MAFDIEMIKRFMLKCLHALSRPVKLNRPPTLTEKILYSHLSPQFEVKTMNVARPMQISTPTEAMQDATAQMALLQVYASRQILLQCRQQCIATT